MTEEYKKYLKSRAWKELRLIRIESDNYTCQTCGNKKPINQLQVHHKTYDRIFNEDLNDLETICRPCHVSEHVHLIRKQEKERDAVKRIEKSRELKKRNTAKRKSKKKQKTPRQIAHELSIQRTLDNYNALKT